MSRPARRCVRLAALVGAAAFAALPASAQQSAPKRTAVHAGTAAAAAATVASDTGQWGPLLSWPLVAVHSVLQPTGSVLVWDGFSNGPNSQRLWEPATGLFTGVPIVNNLFCGGQLALADGRTIVVGGHIQPNKGLAETNLFNPSTNSWVRGADMANGRWYPTGTTLGDGRVLVVSGDNITQDNGLPITPLSVRSDTTPEIYDPRLNAWTSLPTAARAMPLYPFMFVLPDGRVLDAGPEQQSRTLDLATGTWSPLATSSFDGHSAVMYRPGKILKTGKWTDPDYKDLAVTGKAAVLDTTSAVAAWRDVAPMAFPRSYHTLVALPDGNVLAVGGGRTSEGTILANGVLSPEIWDANTETWTTMAPMQTSRLYHSTALLLPDARVLVAGGGALPGSAIDQNSAEVYSPPYLFKGARPSITSSPTTVQYTSTFKVGTPDAARIASVALVRTPAVTHAFDQNQRYVPLTFTASTGGLDVRAPANGNVAPPGYYMLFVVDTNGVPSVASFVRLPAPWEDSVAPSAPSGLAAAGGAGSIGLMWTAAVDNAAVTGYDVHRATTPAFTPSAGNRVGQTALTSFTDTGLAPGTYYYVVVARDAAGNTSAASNVAFATASGDVLPPSVSISAPSAGASVTGVVAVSADASDNVALAGVRFFADGTAIGAEDTSAPYSVDWNTRDTANGVRSLTAVARDAAGNTTTSVAVTVNVVNTASAGLVAAYAFDADAGATVADVSGTDNVGAVSGAAWTAAGRFGGALSFGGMRDWVTIADAPSLDLTDGMTLEAWVRPVALGGIWRTVLIKEQPGDLVYALYAGTDTSVPDAVTYTSGAEQQALGTAQIPLDTWTHLATTYDGATVRLYVNGVLAAAATAFGPMPNSDGPLRIGGNAVWGEYFDGLIDEIRVYGRALSATEIQGDMNTPVTQLPPPPPPTDSTPPTAPTGLVATGSLGTVTLSWNPSTDDVGVSRYNVHRSTSPGFVPSAATRVAQLTGTSFVDAGLAPGVYYYLVTASDAAGNVSAPSAQATGIAAADTSAPTAPGALSATASFGTVTLAWSASSDDVGVVRYNVHRSTTPGFVPDGTNVIAHPTGTSYTDGGLAPDVYYYVVTAEDAAGNVSAASAEATGTAAVDTTAPSVPSALSATGSSGSVRLTWNASSDDVGVTRYNVHRSTVAGFVAGATNLVAQPAGTSYTDVGLAPGTYHYVVTAEDAAGNVSAPSAEVTGIAGDITAPVVALLSPAVGSTVAGTTAVSASASDDVAVTGVQFKLDGVNLGAEDTLAPYSVTWDTRQTLDGPHQLTAVARDAAGNRGTSAPVGVTVDNAKGLVAAYSFDSGSGTTLADTTIYGNGGTISGATWSSSGRFGRALSFDNGDLVSVPDSASLDLTGPMTIEAWLRPSSTNSWRTVAVKEGPGGMMYGLYANSRTSSGGNDGPSGQVFVGGAEVIARATDRIEQDFWTHLAMTYDGAAVRVYENGVLVASRFATGAVASSSGALRIGGNVLRGEFYRGLIDELRIYRRALSSSEIRADMSTPVGP